MLPLEMPSCFVEALPHQVRLNSRNDDPPDSCTASADIRGLPTGSEFSAHEQRQPHAIHGV